ncbi:protein SLC31A2-like [Eupeodes corollae]|uniref:protein SLC31A2-like n=1 Tax=Eupeodes corollae TaxID=290404 RepID=UPI002490941B|nr:protein SLC31A2-like [Eupeodes corollae]XP_055913749.1 protein SLC31A2-like [Eupeodes corollae]XP_055913750.1 protein SLC31A2-like [Eupeodes corollae]XP_055913751.1 protein SLC31A2-like [Eupeodes corollae]XP_055913752.1 protein SLC31A2-like [Eupeodes corollae]XP_055913753.1 protein SLC31A2-like [Eupeodes corollae]
MDHHLMAFHWDTDVGLFLFPGLDITGVPALILLCGILILISIVYEAVKVFQTNSKSKIARERFRSVSSATETTNLLLLERRRSRSNPSENCNSKKLLSIFAQALVFLFQNVTSYLLMLAVMVYNIYVFIAIVFGMGLGYFLFGHISMKINMENIRARTTNALCEERNRADAGVANTISRNVEDQGSRTPVDNHNFRNHSANNYETVSNVPSDVEIHPCTSAQDTDNHHTCRL